MSSLLSAVTGPIKRIPAMVNLATEVNLEEGNHREEASSASTLSISNIGNFQDYGAASAALMQQQQQDMVSIGSAPFDFNTPPAQIKNLEQAVIEEKAVAPVLERPVAPFDKSDRKKAYTNACYYAECFLKGVSPRHADDAASTIQGRYTKVCCLSSSVLL